MINPQWLELPMSRTNSHGPKDVRAIEVRLYYYYYYFYYYYAQLKIKKLSDDVSKDVVIGKECRLIRNVP